MGFLNDITYIARLATREDRSSRDHAREHLGHYLNELLAGTPFEGKLAFDQPKHIDLGRGFFLRPVPDSSFYIETEAQLAFVNSLAQTLSERASSLTEHMPLWGNRVIFGSKKATVQLEPSHVSESARTAWAEHPESHAHISLHSHASTPLLESIQQIKNHLTR